MTAASSQGDDRVSQGDLIKGASALLGEITFTFFIAIFVKWLEPSLPIIVILFFRYLCCLPLLFVYGVASRGKHVMQINNKQALIFADIKRVYGADGVVFGGLHD